MKASHPDDITMGLIVGKLCVSIAQFTIVSLRTTSLDRGVGAGGGGGSSPPNIQIGGAEPPPNI